MSHSRRPSSSSRNGSELSPKTAHLLTPSGGYLTVSMILVCLARSNSISDLRKSEPDKAYFGCHTDITIPYDELGSIEAVRADGSRITIIKDGRFVLPGTEELNKAFDAS